MLRDPGTISERAEEKPEPDLDESQVEI